MKQLLLILFSAIAISASAQSPDSIRVLYKAKEVFTNIGFNTMSVKSVVVKQKELTKKQHVLIEVRNGKNQPKATRVFQFNNSKDETAYEIKFSAGPSGKFKIPLSLLKAALLKEKTLQIFTFAEQAGSQLMQGRPVERRYLCEITLE